MEFIFTTLNIHDFYYEIISNIKNNNNLIHKLLKSTYGIMLPPPVI